MLLRISFLLIFCATLSVAANEVTDSIAAKVNGKIITTFDVLSLTARREEAIRRSATSAEANVQIAAVRNDALLFLIEKALILSEFRGKGYPVPPKAVESRIERVVRDQFNGSRERFYSSIEDAGKSLSEYRTELEDSIIYEMMMGEFVSRKAAVTPDAIKAYYESHKSDYHIVKKLEARIIYFAAKSLQDRKVVELQQSLAAGASFADLAKKHSVLPNAKEGGDLGGLVEYSHLKPEFIEHLKPLKDGEVCAPFLMQSGVVFLQLIRRQAESFKGLVEVYDSIEAQLIKKQEKVLRREFIDSLRKKSSIDIMGVK